MTGRYSLDTNNETPREETGSCFGACLGNGGGSRWEWSPHTREGAKVSGRMRGYRARRRVQEVAGVLGRVSEAINRIRAQYPDAGKVFPRLAGCEATGRPDQCEHADAICARLGTVRRLSAGHPAAVPRGQHHGERD